MFKESVTQNIFMTITSKLFDYIIFSYFIGLAIYGYYFRFASPIANIIWLTTGAIFLTIWMLVYRINIMCQVNAQKVEIIGPNTKMRIWESKNDSRLGSRFSLLTDKNSSPQKKLKAKKILGLANHSNHCCASNCEVQQETKES